jgi:hypothetical protein
LKEQASDDDVILMDRISFCVDEVTNGTLTGLSYHIISGDSQQINSSVGNTTNCTEYTIDYAGGEFVETVQV